MVAPHGTLRHCLITIADMDKTAQRLLAGSLDRTSSWTIVSSGYSTSQSTSWSLSLPSTIQAGDVIIFLASTSVSQATNAVAGFSIIKDITSYVSVGVSYYIYDFQRLQHKQATVSGAQSYTIPANVAIKWYIARHKGGVSTYSISSYMGGTLTSITPDTVVNGTATVSSNSEASLLFGILSFQGNPSSGFSQFTANSIAVPAINAMRYLSIEPGSTDVAISLTILAMTFSARTSEYWVGAITKTS